MATYDYSMQMIVSFTVISINSGVLQISKVYQDNV